jgi:hypothetical protein
MLLLDEATSSLDAVSEAQVQGERERSTDTDTDTERAKENGKTRSAQSAPAAHAVPPCCSCPDGHGHVVLMVTWPWSRGQDHVVRVT